jgi:hypothetical protein
MLFDAGTATGRIYGVRTVNILADAREFTVLPIEFRKANNAAWWQRIKEFSPQRRREHRARRRKTGRDGPIFLCTTRFRRLARCPNLSGWAGSGIFFAISAPLW